ncbi:MAG: (cytosine-5-)-methyltransferase [Bacteroidota bacterium]|jgi:DNA (cytosine-5)-methyltransferase 1
MIDSTKNSINDYAVVDLFCGVGGLTHGFVKEKFDVVAGIDFDGTCKYAFEKNNKTTFLHRDITKVTSKEIEELYPKEKRKILVGCAPCQPFSIYTNIKKEKSDDEKWKLLYEFSRVIKDLQPDIISMENVPQLEKFENGKVLKDFIAALKEEKYFVKYKIVNAQNYGVPQRRKRLILFASKYGEVEILNETHNSENYVTVKDAIGNLPPIEDGVHHPEDKLHFARELTPKNKLRIRATKEGGSWKDWSEDLVLDCHKKESGKSFGSVYGRMVWNDVSPTLTTYCVGLGNGRFGHPEQHRALSLREAAILQSFPKNYDFIDKSVEFSSAKIARQIGNAVPVGLGVMIAKSIKNHLKNNLK